MPISIAGSGTITGISAGGLPDDCITTAEIAANAVTTAKLGSAEASGLAKAWVNFNGTGTVAIRASYNVSSITDNGTGDYTVNFTTALADANYSMTASCSYRSGNNYNSAHIFTNASGTIVAPTTTAARLQLSTVTLGSADSEYVTVAIFR